MHRHRPFLSDMTTNHARTAVSSQLFWHRARQHCQHHSAQELFSVSHRLRSASIATVSASDMLRSRLRTSSSPMSNVRTSTSSENVTRLARFALGSAVTHEIKTLNKIIP
eukprot:7079596-Prymnesium_polylepis.1